jgi:hypothetical protein
VDVGVDPAQTGVTTTMGATGPDGGIDVIIVIIPRDKFGNNLGPGRQDGFSVSGASGTTVTGLVQDNGDGSYTVSGVWNSNSNQDPGVIIGQPGRPPVIVHEPKAPVKHTCALWKILCLILLILLLLLLIIWLLK